METSRPPEDDTVEARWNRAYPRLSGTGRTGGHRELLQRLEHTYRSSALQLRGFAKPDEAALIEGFAARARFSREEPEAVRRLQSILDRLQAAPSLRALLAQALEAGMSLTRADRGNIQLLDPSTGTLKIAAHHGFADEFLEYFAAVHDDSSACGRAAHRRKQTVIVDVNIDSDFAPHRDIAAASSFRAVQSTPLTNNAGRLVGVISTHYPHPAAPNERDLEIAKRFGERTGILIGQRQSSLAG